MKKKILQFFYKFICLNILVNSIFTNSHFNTKFILSENQTKIINDVKDNEFRKLNLNISEIYKSICIEKNYSYELMNYIDPLSKTFSQYMNFTFIKNTDSSVKII